MELSAVSIATTYVDIFKLETGRSTFCAGSVIDRAYRDGPVRLACSIALAFTAFIVDRCDQVPLEAISQQSTTKSLL